MLHYWNRFLQLVFIIRHTPMNWPHPRSQKLGQSHVPPLHGITKISLAAFLPLTFVLGTLAAHCLCRFGLKMEIQNTSLGLIDLSINWKNCFEESFCLFICKVATTEVKTYTKTVVALNVNIYCYYFRYILTANDQLELITHQFWI